MVVVAVGKAVGETVIPGVEGALVDSHAPKRAARPVIAVKMMRGRFISLFSSRAIVLLNGDRDFSSTIGF
jgi:hypothetical protein